MFANQILKQVILYGNPLHYFACFPEQFCEYIFRVHLGILHWQMAGIFGEFFRLSVSHETKHEKSSKNSGKIQSKIRVKFGTKIRKIRETFVLQLFWPNLTSHESETGIGGVKTHRTLEGGELALKVVLAKLGLLTPKLRIFYRKSIEKGQISGPPKNQNFHPPLIFRDLTPIPIYPEMYFGPQLFFFLPHISKIARHCKNFLKMDRILSFFGGSIMKQWETLTKSAI